jgi:hypothetical protein
MIADITRCVIVVTGKYTTNITSEWQIKFFSLYGMV